MDESQTSRMWLHTLLAVTTLFLAACDESMHASYATAAAARADGAVERGWLPQELPDSATAIEESHDLDTNTGSGTFHFGAADADSFRAKLLPASPAQVQQFRYPEQLQREGYTFYAAPEFVLAVNWQTRHVRFILLSQSR